MKVITKVVSSVIGVVASLAGIGTLTACSSSDGPAVTCEDSEDVNDCKNCCASSADPDVCVEDYIKNGFCHDNSPTNKYGPLSDPVYGPPDWY